MTKQIKIKIDLYQEKNTVQAIQISIHSVKCECLHWDNPRFQSRV